MSTSTLCVLSGTLAVLFAANAASAGTLTLHTNTVTVKPIIHIGPGTGQAASPLIGQANNTNEKIGSANITNRPPTKGGVLMPKLHLGDAYNGKPK
jgi:hypothetical protein